MDSDLLEELGMRGMDEAPFYSPNVLTRDSSLLLQRQTSFGSGGAFAPSPAANGNAFVWPSSADPFIDSMPLSSSLSSSSSSVTVHTPSSSSSPSSSSISSRPHSPLVKKEVLDLQVDSSSIDSSSSLSSSSLSAASSSAGEGVTKIFVPTKVRGPYVPRTKRAKKGAATGSSSGTLSSASSPAHGASLDDASSVLPPLSLDPAFDPSSLLPPSSTSSSAAAASSSLSSSSAMMKKRGRAQQDHHHVAVVETATVTIKREKGDREVEGTQLSFAHPVDSATEKRERNKVSATAYRKRRKVYLDGLEAQISGLESENQSLKEEVEALRRRLAQQQQQQSSPSPSTAASSPPPAVSPLSRESSASSTSTDSRTTNTSPSSPIRIDSSPDSPFSPSLPPLIHQSPAVGRSSPPVTPTPSPISAAAAAAAASSLPSNLFSSLRSLHRSQAFNFLYVMLACLMLVNPTLFAHVRLPATNPHQFTSHVSAAAAAAAAAAEFDELPTVGLTPSFGGPAFSTSVSHYRPEQYGDDDVDMSKSEKQRMSVGHPATHSKKQQPNAPYLDHNLVIQDKEDELPFCSSPISPTPDQQQSRASNCITSAATQAAPFPNAEIEALYAQIFASQQPTASNATSSSLAPRSSSPPAVLLAVQEFIVQHGVAVFSQMLGDSLSQQVSALATGILQQDQE